MWIYEKKLQFPVKITQPDARMAKVIIEQYGGADGELGATLRYLSQKFTMVTPEAKATLNDIALLFQMKANTLLLLPLLCI